MSIKYLFFALILATSVFAADWIEVPLKYTWDRKSVGFCSDANQCLLGNAFNESWNNIPDRYWSGVLNSERPKCIADGQYVADYYCDRGNWSSRTKLVAQQLLSLSLEQQPGNFSLYCDSYDATLNLYDYQTNYGTVTSFIRTLCPQSGNRRSIDCLNHICVAKTGTLVTFGFAFNTDISSAKSPLHALNVSSTFCDSVKNNDEDYDLCGNDIWYNHNLQSIIYASTPSLPAPTHITSDFFMLPYRKLMQYTFRYAHQPDVAQYNFSVFNMTPLFDTTYLSKKDNQFIYGFKQTNVTLSQFDYGGMYYSNINMPTDACQRIFKRYDSTAFCEQQPIASEFYVVARKTPPVNQFDKRKSILDAWNDLTGKMRMNQ